MATAALERRTLAEDVQKLTVDVIRDPIVLAEKMRQLQQLAHIISPAASFAAIPPNVVITPVPVVIDTTFDAKTGRGVDVYFQMSIHKSENRGTRAEPDWQPLEVSLNANAIKRILRSAGVNVTKSERTDDQTNPHICSWTTWGKVREFDGSWLDLPPGDVCINLADGSDDIGGFTAEAWAARVTEADKRREAAEKAKEKDAWKIKAEAINGWSGERVAGQRKSIVPMAQTKSLNRLGRGLGLQQIYTIADLQKPFVVFRASWVHDMTNPDVAKMVTASELGIIDQLFAPSTRDWVPAGAQEIDDIPEPIAEKPAQTYTLTKALQLGERYFFESAEGKTFTTTDRETARGLNAARKDKTVLVIDDPEPVDVDGKTYLSVVEFKAFTPATAKKY